MNYKAKRTDFAAVAVPCHCASADGLNSLAKSLRGHDSEKHLHLSAVCLTISFTQKQPLWRSSLDALFAFSYTEFSITDQSSRAS